MKKIKISKLLTSLALVISASIFLQTKSVFAAATPGCYIQTLSRAGGSTRTVTCPTEGMARATSGTNGKCYLAMSSVENPPADQYKETPCASITSSTVGAGTGAGSAADGLEPLKVDESNGKFVCGKGPSDSDKSNEVKVSFNFGCLGLNYDGPALNPIVDIAFAIFRFLSVGVGMIVIGSIIVAGIQYSISRGDPQKTVEAIKRITNSLIALLIYIFMFAILNFLVPGGMFI